MALAWPEDYESLSHGTLGQNITNSGEFEKWPNIVLHGSGRYEACCTGFNLCKYHV